jgi:uncharacterized membrane protein YbhN (UPF0104 family)
LRSLVAPAMTSRLASPSRELRSAIGLALIAVFCQIFRNRMLLHAVGVDASIFDAVAVLIAVVALGQLPAGPGAGAGSARADPRRRGGAATAAAGVIMTVTGTVGGLIFVVWGAAGHL